MKVRVCELKSGENFTGGFNSRLLQFAIEYKLTSRFAVLLLLAALLSPLFLLESSQTVSAASSSPIISQMPAPVSAPPESFVLASPLSGYLSGSITSNALSPVIAFSTFVSNGYSSVANYFTAPSLPEGFAMAQPASPFGSSVSSAVSSFGSFFGLIVPSAKSANTGAAGSAAAVEPVAALLSQAAGSVSFDFDGDGKADVARWKPSTKEWKVKQSASGAYLTQTIGTSSAALIAPGDFDGDGKTDSAIFNAGTWTINKSASGTTQTVSFGQAGDKPMVGDYDGDGTADVAVFRPSTTTWLILNSSNGTTTTTQFGASGDIAVAGNYDGDNRTDIAVYRPSSGYWYVQGSTAGFSTTQWGNASDIPVPADYDGDGKTDKAVFRNAVGTWYVLQSSNGATLSPAWGNYGDQPVPADYDGDGKADFSVWRPTTGVWHITKSATGAYQSESLGVPGDTAVSSAYLKQIGSQIYSYDFARTRLSPKNGSGGTDLYSRNFSWGAGLVNLPGRAGLDVGLGISYNSLVWTKDGSTMVFDADKSNVSPGFRFGFPVIEPIYLDSATGKYNYLMVTPSGAKVEFKQTTASSVYETADSSYTQLVLNGLGSPTDPVENLSITVTVSDGTQMKYSWIGNAYRCISILDRNGNLITIGNDEYGSLKTITDTLGRVVNVNYDMDLNPVSITQNWKDLNGSGATQLHTYATFYYTPVTMYPSFSSGLSIYGPATGTIKALQSIVYPGGSSTRFEYNVFGQVYKVSNYAADDHELNRARVNLSNGDLYSPQADCPRFSQTINYVENFNQDTGGTAQEVVINNTVTENSGYSLPGNINGTATKIEVSMPGHPNGAISKTYVGASGWKESLPIATEDFADGVRKRWTWTDWTQDDTNLSYVQNPRVIESKVGDTTNTKRTTVGYEMQSGSTTVSRYGLVNEVAVYNTDQSTVLKKSTTTYNFDNAYISRRIIGLPTMSQLFEAGNPNPISKVTYLYDEGDLNGTALNQNITSATQRSTKYGAIFVIGRGNLTSTTRHDVTGQTSAVTSSVKYNTLGSVVSQTDPLNRTVTISYADVFNDTPTSRNTFAYPTKLTDPAGNFSEVKYRYDTGANVWAKSPAPQNQLQGKISERLFDTVGRLEKQIILNNGAYTRYEYPTNGVQSKVFATITAGAGEAVSESWTDGAGRIRKSRSEMPSSTGGWSGTLTEYDILGRAKRQSVPTEIDGNWNAAGDDLTRGFLWTSQEYDWKGRVTKQINTNGTFKTVSYEGCGCAGGQVTTLQSELVPRDDEPNTLARRTQKVYADILGRTNKAEILNWNGSVYSTAVSEYNGRDQATTIINTQEATSTTLAVSQTTTMSYDGHGRLKTQHRPEQIGNTAYNYYGNDSIESIVDARGAITSYTYNNRGLVNLISYAPPSGIPDTADVTFSYDAAGNRTQMDDGPGVVDYSYNELSQMTSETRRFDDSLPNAPLVDGNQAFKLNYDYTLSGQLKSLKDPYGQQFNYAFDKIGRLSSVTGSTAFSGVTNYASNPQYRAWGGLKNLTYGNGLQMAQTFDNRLQTASYSLTGAINPTMQKAYQYYEDGQLKYVQDQLNPVFDRLNIYDHAGRIKDAKSGAEARGEPASAPLNRTLPYRQKYEYDAFDNLTKRDNLNWGYSQVNGLRNFNLTYAYENNRVVGIFNWTYDADGRNTYSSRPDENTNSTYDAAGRLVMIDQQDAHVVTNRYFDGAGAELKSTARDTTNNEIRVKYYLRSSVLGGEIISEANQTGKKIQTRVHAAGAVLARQTTYDDPSGNPIESIEFEQWDASGMSYRRTYGNTTNMYDGVSASGETDPMGGGVGMDGFAYAEANRPPERDYPMGQLRGEGETAVYQNGQWVPCVENGFQTSCARAQRNLADGITIRIISASAFLRVTRGNDTLFNGAIILNNGFGVGMVDASTFDQTSMINLSNLGLNGNDVARAQETGNWAGLIVGTRQTEATTRVTSWGGNSSRAWVNVAVDFNGQLGQSGEQSQQQQTKSGTARGNQIKESKECKQHRLALENYLGYFNELWKATKSGAEGTSEQGGLIGVNITGEVIAGRGEPIVARTYTGKTERQSMGGDFTIWARTEISSSKNTVAYLYFVHTHPSGSTTPSSPGRSASGTGDVKGAEFIGLPGVIITANKISVFNGTGKICEFKRN